MLDRVGEAGQTAAGEEDLARPVPTNAVAPDHHRSTLRVEPGHARLLDVP